MKAILQRVTFAEVKVDGNTVGKIDNGFLILLGVAEGDTEKEADALSSKIATLRVFTDENDKMNLSLADIDGEVLVISNFTLLCRLFARQTTKFYESRQARYCRAFI